MLEQAVNSMECVAEWDRRKNDNGKKQALIHLIIAGPGWSVLELCGLTGVRPTSNHTSLNAFTRALSAHRPLIGPVNNDANLQG